VAYHTIGTTRAGLKRLLENLRLPTSSAEKREASAKHVELTAHGSLLPADRGEGVQVAVPVDGRLATALKMQEAHLELVCACTAVVEKLGELTLIELIPLAQDVEGRYQPSVDRFRAHVAPDRAGWRPAR
jgi:hypothetical protein